jgi:ATP-dependent Lon protease
VILPEGNKPDWLDVPAEVRSKLKVHFVKQISEVLQLALLPK